MFPCVVRVVFPGLSVCSDDSPKFNGIFAATFRFAAEKVKLFCAETFRLLELSLAIVSVVDPKYTGAFLLSVVDVEFNRILEGEVI
jgi:hypothetical protein